MREEPFDRQVECAGKMVSTYSTRHLVLITLLSWVSQIGFDLFQGAGVFAKLWLEARAVFLPPEQMFKLIPVGYLSFLISSSLLVWLMVRLGISGWKPGALFGLKLSGFLSSSWVLGVASVFPVKVVVLIVWLFVGLAQLSIAAAVIGSGLQSEHLGRLTAKVGVFLLVSALAAVILQNLGMAPAMKYVK